MATTKVKAAKRGRGKNVFLVSVLGPTFIWFLIFFIIPIISVIIYSLTNANMAYSTFKFVGLEQYIKAFTQDAIFMVSLRNTVVAALVIVPATVVFSILLAGGLNAMSNKVRQAYTFVFFLPSIVSAVAISLVWDWLYHKTFGLFNAMLNLAGLPAQGFLKSASQALVSLCVIEIWSSFGYFAVILLAAMRGIDSSVYEAADIDGAGPLTKFLRITIPLIKNNILFVCIMSTTSAFMFITPVKILTDGTPGSSTMVIMLHVLKRGIQNNDVGYASAMSIILMLIILFFSFIQFLITRERKEKARHYKGEV